MALIVKDRVKETFTTTGTTNFTLGGASAGFQTFAVIGNTNTTYYAAVDQTTGDWEVGIGTYSSTGPTLTRDTVLESSNSGSKVNFAAGSKDVFCTYPAERSVYLNAAGSAVDVLDIGTLGTSTANITTANITAGTVSTTPTNGNDLANKTYVDTMVSSGITFHTPVRVESPINLNATYNNGTAGVGATLTNAGAQAALVIDGVTVSVNDRVLVYQQTTQTQNGIYVVTNVGSGSTNWVLTRASDANTYGVKSPNSLGEGDAFFVQEGATGAGETYVCNTVGTITFGTTNITFVQVSSAQIYSAGTGLTLSGTQFSITNTGTAGTYGSASSVPVFVTNAQGQVTSVTPTAIAIAAAAVSGLAPSATTDTTNAANITSGTLPSARINGSYTGLTGVGTLTAGTWNATAIGATFGGTGQTSYTQGDLLYATSSTALGKLADVATGNALISGGVGGDPAWGKIGLQTHVDGTLQVANGGTGATTLTGYVYGNGTGAMTASTSIPNSATTATSANTASAIVARDGSGNFSAGTITASLSGNASTATSATSATTATNLAGGVAGAVPYQSGSGATAFSAAGTSGQYLQSNGTSAPSWATLPTIGNGTLSMAVSGTGLSGSASFTANQSGNSTFTVTSNATNANTANTIVARDGSGNFSAGTVTAALSGNATTATTLQTARTINGVSFDGSANITVTASTPNSLTLATSGTGLSGSATFNGGSAQTFTVTSNATSTNTANAIVARDGSGNFSAGTITASLSGTATTASTANALNTANSYTGTGFTATTAQAYIIANRTSSGSGQVGYNWAQGGSNLWWNYVDTGATTLSWYNSVSSTNVMTLTTGGALNTAGAITQNGSQVLTAGNYTSYSPTLTGGGASGTWGINITGNSATATALSSGRSNWSGTGVLGNVVGQLAWRNYGNGHTIFDASASVSPDGGSVNNTNAQIAWTGTYPTLMGWNGANTYGVRVDSARVADSAGSATSATNATNATNLNGSGSISSTTTATTQAAKTSDTSVATTAFVDRLRGLLTATTGTGGGTTVIGDRGCLVSVTAGVTIPANVYAANDTFTIYNNTAGNLTITQGASLTLRQVGTANTGNRTLAQRGLATVLFISATEAVITGGGLT